MKTAILVFVVGYMPVPIVFATHEACHEVEESFKRLADKHTPKQIYINGHQPTIDFIPCVDMR